MPIVSTNLVTMPATAESQNRTSPLLHRLVTALAFALAVGVIVALAAYRLRDYRYPLNLAAAVRGAATTAHVTIRAALGTWFVVAVALAASGAWLRRRVPDLSPAEVVAAAVVLVWSGTYAVLLTLGPLGLYRPLVLRGLVLALALAALRFWRHPHPATPQHRSSGEQRQQGAWIAVGAFALAAGPLLLMQIGSPVSPFMDVLPYIASAQKIVTFRFYDPFGNDAAGLWSPTRQLVGCDAPFSFLALVTNIPAHLAITSLIVPLAALQVLGIYLLGRRVHGGLAGGMAAIFLLQTFVWRRTADGRGTALAFALVTIGLAFLLATRARGPRLALGGLALGLAVTVNPLIGATGMQVATAATVIEAIDFRRGLIPRVLALAAGSIFALPQVLIGLAWRVPAWTLPIAVACGAALALRLARRTPEDDRPAPRAWPVARLTVILALPITILFLHARRQSEFFTYDWFGYGPLMLLAAGGIAVLAHETWRRPERWPSLAVPALAFWVTMIDHAIADPLRFQGSLEMRALASEVTPKMVLYCAPYWLALLTGIWFGMLAHRWARLPAVVLALALVTYPLHYVQEPLDFDGQQLSLAETWGFHLTNAANGYWAGYGDRRWVLDANGREVADVLLAEVAAGRITYDTHVLQIAPALESVETAVVTGISLDLVAPNYAPNNPWTLGGRGRGLDSLPAAFAARPRYVVLRQYQPERFPELSAYDEIVARSYLRLYRLRESESASVPSAS